MRSQAQFDQRSFKDGLHVKIIKPCASSVIQNKTQQKLESILSPFKSLSLLFIQDFQVIVDLIEMVVAFEVCFWSHSLHWCLNYSLIMVTTLCHRLHLSQHQLFMHQLFLLILVQFSLVVHLTVILFYPISVMSILQCVPPT